MDDKFAERLVLFRNRKGRNQDELASKLDVSRQSISNWENGTSIPSIEFVKKLAELYEISIDDLLNTSKPIEDCYKKEFKYNKNKDTININKDGLNINNEDGSINIEWDKEFGAKIKDCVESEIVDGEIIDDKSKKEKTNSKKKFFYKSIEGSINLICFIIALVAYIVLGFLLKDGWRNYWVLFIYSFIPGELFHSIAFKKGKSFPILFLSLSIYFTIGMFLNLWHPYWVILISIPVYYMIYGSIKSIIKNAKNYKE